MAETPSATPTSNELDLVFVCDCTGSMGSYIAAAQQNMRKIVEDIVAAEKSDVRFALIEYRDHPPQDNSFATRVHDFTNSAKEMKGYVDQMAANGGGDGPESVACALEKALSMPYRKKAAKVVVFIADAPPHGLEANDGFPQGCPCGFDPIEIAHSMAEAGIVVYSVGCEPALGGYQYARDFMRSVAKITEGQFMPLGDASLLAKAIVGGAVEELSMERLMAQVGAEVEREKEEYRRTSDGKEMAEEEVVQRVTAKLQERNVETNQLEVESVYDGALDDTNVEMLSKASKLSGVKGSLKQVTQPRVKSSVASHSRASRPSLGRGSVGRRVETEKLRSTRGDTKERKMVWSGGAPAARAAESVEEEEEKESDSAPVQKVEWNRSKINTTQVSKMMNRATKRGGWEK